MPPSACSLSAFYESLHSGLDPASVQFSPVIPRYQPSSTVCQNL